MTQDQANIIARLTASVCTLLRTNQAMEHEVQEYAAQVNDAVSVIALGSPDAIGAFPFHEMNIMLPEDLVKLKLFAWPKAVDVPAAAMVESRKPLPTMYDSVKVKCGGCDSLIGRFRPWSDHGSMDTQCQNCGREVTIHQQALSFPEQQDTREVDVEANCWVIRAPVR